MHENLQQLQKEMEAKGAKLITTEYKDRYTPIYFYCSKCGQTHYISWDNYLAGYNKNFLCKDCFKTAKPKIEDIRKIFEDLGATLLTTEYVNQQTPLQFICSRCKENTNSITWKKFKAGNNPNLICQYCSGKKKLSFDDVKKRFNDYGVELISTSYIPNEPLKFKCKNCGNVHTILLAHVGHYNTNFLCEACMRGRAVNPTGDYAKGRHNIDNLWYTFVKEFFGIHHRNFSLYSAHHILQFGKFPEYRTSIVNGYPLKVALHQEKGDKYHLDPAFQNPENWLEEAKLPHHTYDNFKFLNLNECLVTEIFSCDEHLTDKNYLISQKEKWDSKGIFYMPIFLEELLSYEKKEIIYSIIRNKLYSKYPIIYDYTRKPLQKYYARKLLLKEIEDSKLCQNFFNSSHIYGFIGAKITLGLFTEDNELVCAMSFGTPRAKRYQGDNNYELLRLATKKNTLVVGGASRLFKFFVDNYYPNFIISYCDIRFSSLNPEDTIYHRLGFVYAGFSKPNYKYVHPDENRLFSRQQFQKYKLKDKLQDFNEDMTERENMQVAGYLQQYDCGNHRFIWRSPVIR